MTQRSNPSFFSQGSVLSEFDFDVRIEPPNSNKPLEIKGGYEGFFDPTTNVHGGVGWFDEIPELGNWMLMASYGSWASWRKCIYSKPMSGAVNLIGILGEHHQCEVRYVHLDSDGEIIGNVFQVGEVEEVTPGRCSGTVSMSGFYKGPTNLTWSPGYAVYLRQAGPGEIEGTYSQTILAGDRSFRVCARRRYLYDTGKTLPFDEVWHYKLLTMDVQVEDERRLFDYRATAFYTPAEAEHGAIEDADQIFNAIRQPEVVHS